MCYAPWLKYRCVLLSSAVDSQRQQIILQSCTLKSFDQNPKQLYYCAFLFSFLKNNIFNGLHFSPFVMKSNCRFAENNSSDPFWRTLNEEKVIVISVNYWGKSPLNRLENWKILLNDSLWRLFCSLAEFLFSLNPFSAVLCHLQSPLSSTAAASASIWDIW